MTAKTIEDMLIAHTRSIASLEVGLQSFREEFSEKARSDGTRSEKLERAID